MSEAARTKISYALMIVFAIGIGAAMIALNILTAQ